MTSTERLSAVECAPWCVDGDGHVDAVCAEDQNCMGESNIIPVSLRDQKGCLGVLAWRDHGEQPDVVVNIYVDDVDVDVHLTPGQARLLAESLLSVTKTVEGTR